MITVRVLYNERQDVTSFEISGHSGYSKAGHDIVCAAVSAVTNLVLIGLMKELSIKLDLKNNDGGYLKCDLPKGIDKEISDKAQLLIGCMIKEFQDIESNYGKYIEIKQEK